MQVVRLDGSPTAVAVLVAALRSALDGGPAVLPVGPGLTPPTDLPVPPPGTAVVLGTSGSTGEPKLVALPAAALRASAEATATRLGGSAGWLLALPGEHIAGAQVIVRAVLADADPLVQDLRQGFRPASFAAGTAALGDRRRHTSLVPTQLLRLLDDAAGLTALRSYAAVLVGGAALDPTLHDRARAAGVHVVTTYGMSETAGGCVYDGVPLDGVLLDIDAGGRIRLAGPTLATGYLGRAGDPAFADGWFHTGDLGRIRDGRLEVLGRADDVIITGGANVAPGAVERVLAAQPGVQAACVVGVPDPEWGQIVAAAVVRGPESPADWTAHLRAAVRTELGRAAVPRRWCELDALPLRGIGKPDRMAVARLVTNLDVDHHHIG